MTESKTETNERHIWPCLNCDEETYDSRTSLPDVHLCAKCLEEGPLYRVTYADGRFFIAAGLDMVAFWIESRAYYEWSDCDNYGKDAPEVDATSIETAQATTDARMEYYRAWWARHPEVGEYRAANGWSKPDPSGDWRNPPDFRLVITPEVAK